MEGKGKGATERGQDGFTVSVFTTQGHERILNKLTATKTSIKMQSASKYGSKTQVFVTIQRQVKNTLV